MREGTSSGRVSVRGLVRWLHRAVGSASSPAAVLVVEASASEDELRAAAFRQEVLFDAAQDPLGVYEVRWAANTRYPRMAVDARWELAARTVRTLLHEEAVLAFESDWPPTSFAPVDTASALERLGDHRTWVLTPTGPVLWIAAADGASSSRR